MRVRSTGVAALVLALFLATGCSGDTGGTAPVSMAQVGRAVAADPVLHWTGGWRWSGHAIAVDLRTLGSGDGLGTVTIDGQHGQLLLGHGRMFVRANAGYWRAAGKDKTDAARLAGGWADAGNPDRVDDLTPLNGVLPTMLTPTVLGKRLGSIRSCARHRADRAAAGRTATPARGSRPAGVPANALRFDAPAGCEKGTYWVSATGAHQLLAYRGTDQPAADWSADPISSSGVTDTRLAVRAGSTAQARTEYRHLAATAATVPGTIPARSDAADEVSVSVDAEDSARAGYCLYIGCDHLDLVVTADNNSNAVTASLTVTVRVIADDRTVGRCRLRKHVLPPGAHRTWPCPVTGPRLAKATENANTTFWDATPTFDSFTEASHASALADRFRTAAARLG